MWTPAKLFLVPQNRVVSRTLNAEIGHRINLQRSTVQMRVVCTVRQTAIECLNGGAFALCYTGQTVTALSTATKHWEEEP